MKKCKGIIKIILLSVLALSLLAVAYAYRTSNLNDKNRAPKCEQIDRDQNNCVPAGRCTPPGNPVEATTDCDIKKYDHKYIYTHRVEHDLY